MKKQIITKCMVALGLYLFFTVIFPIPVTGNIMVANASSLEGEQSEVKLNVKSKSLVKDTSYSLKVYNVLEGQKVTYKSNDSSIASVDENGVIKAADFGNTTITVTVKDSLKTIATLECSVTVGPPAISVILTKKEITLKVGDKTSLIAIVKPNNTVEEAKFSSNDSTIVTVSTGGRITAKAVGETYVFASIGNGTYDLCKVTVVEETKKDNTETTENSNTSTNSSTSSNNASSNTNTNNTTSNTSSNVNSK